MLKTVEMFNSDAKHGYYGLGMQGHFITEPNPYRGKFAVYDTESGDYVDPAYLHGLCGLTLPAEIHPKHDSYNNPDNFTFATKKQADILRLFAQTWYRHNMFEGYEQGCGKRCPFCLEQDRQNRLHPAPVEVETPTVDQLEKWVRS